MAFNITFQEFNTETITKGRNSYEKGVVTYTFNGSNKTQTLMSFANPAVFSFMKKASPGQQLTVETSKNDAGFDQWSKVSLAGASPPSPAAAASSNTKVSTYETPEERKARQRLIVKQSSLGAAVETLSVGAKAPPKKEDVLALAQDYVDWVFDLDTIFFSGKKEELTDVPY